ncbi:MAG: hypothetical protein C3F07_12865 [Anaerolineales bacterium]|nr:hypothetical protein [Anaerolineae bacterium]PWB71998.1 MAG: hypothetical protein C3F07_12865 [Anaerolineales bacterium]
MKPRTYFGLALLFPYVLWILCALIVFGLSSLETPEFLNTVFMPVFFYAFGILLWFVPYTILAIGLWFWSRGRSAAILYKAGVVAPFLLVALMLVELLLVSLPADSFAELTRELVGQSVMLGGFSLIFGYLCVGVALGVLKLLRARNLIAEETPIPG